MGVSFQELILLLMIGLIVLGPERLPRVANQLGSWLGQARRMTRVMKRQLEDELNLDRQFDMLPPARTRHATPGTFKPPVGGQAGGGDAPAGSSDATPVSAASDSEAAGHEAPPAAGAAVTRDSGDDAEKDDTWSPAHGAADVGTGVGDEAGDDAAPAEPTTGDAAGAATPGKDEARTARAPAGDADSKETA